MSQKKIDFTPEAWAVHLAAQRAYYASRSHDDKVRLWYSANRRYREKNKGNPVMREKHRIDAARRYRNGETLDYLFRKKYGITKLDYEQMCKTQEGRCLICARVPIKKLTVDHCHRTGRVRGLLCSHCNSVLGLARDNVTTLLSAIEYLKKGSN